jgi:hypothetical protein
VTIQEHAIAATLVNRATAQRGIDGRLCRREIRIDGPLDTGSSINVRLAGSPGVTLTITRIQ